jgi:hypothetical protein
VTSFGGDGKTTIMLQLAVAIAGDRPWLGYNPEAGPVLFLSAEDDEEELHRRCTSIGESLGVPLAELSDLHLVPLAGRDAVLGGRRARWESWPRLLSFAGSSLWWKGGNLASSSSTRSPTCSVASKTPGAAICRPLEGPGDRSSARRRPDRSPVVDWHVNWQRFVRIDSVEQLRSVAPVA